MEHEFENSRVYLMDCMEGMAKYPDNHFELAVVDPPYGIGMSGTIGIGVGKDKGFTRKKEYVNKEWDNSIPNAEYFYQLIRVSKKQIIWGANYFTHLLPPLKNYIFWYKKGQSVDSKFNDGELAYVSKGYTRMVDIWWNGVGVINSKENRIHPTQKPVALYDWIFKNYAKEGDKILDTHLGSQSSRISAYKNGLDFTGYELDEDYFRDGNKRFTDFTNQLVLI